MTPRWTRERARGGPADTLDGRYEVLMFERRWAVWDRLRNKYVAADMRTMRDARNEAEWRAMFEAWHIADEIDRLERAR